MLKKTLKKLLALTLTTVTLVTSAMPVSASTLTPKKTHKDSEVQERVLYLIDAADDIAFSPYSGFAGDAIEGDSYSRRNKKHSYMAYQMCNMLFATPNLKSACDSQTIAELKKARKTWKAAYVSDLMYSFYSQVWYDTYFLVDSKYMTVSYKNPRAWHDYSASNTVLHLQPTKILNKATSSYNRVKKYIAKYQKYNPTLAAKLTKWNKTQYEGYKKLANKVKTLTVKDYVNKMHGGSDEVLYTVWQYYKLPRLSCEDGQLYEETKLVSKVSNWYVITKGMHWNSINPDAPFYVFAKNVKYGAW